ncbi:UPF0575 protein C19orf67 homolog isoform X2 [Phyllopteryx taeniolatus]|uniref:UPF0575 protein C19orf67 homolog isoform X2 n=1 Tax=Phyllopteryx taeniolatus TaxID=161469 RepID=UPI002AD4EFF8|nr:UPF0575 protein C19orf67 homolog isoform X2 [Phyllopteryx taeniolatus]
MSSNDSEEMAGNLLPGRAGQVRHRVRGSAQAGLEVAAVRSFTGACQPYFNFLESTARTMQLPPEMYVQLMEFSQQMCDTLEHLILTFASTNLLTLDESEPNNMSHFCIGQIRLDQLRLSVTMFRYCKPTPYLARVNTGVFKRMRWNVRGLDGESKPETQYYYLCYEDTPNLYTDGDDPDSAMVRLWSIGQWVQVKPDPNTEDIFDWVLCDVPEGAFQKLLFMGSQEPSSCTATDHLLQLLLHQASHFRAPLRF